MTTEEMIKLAQAKTLLPECMRTLDPVDRSYLDKACKTWKPTRREECWNWWKDMPKEPFKSVTREQFAYIWKETHPDDN